MEERSYLVPCSYVTVVAAVDVAAVAVGTIALLVQILSGRDWHCSVQQVTAL